MKLVKANKLANALKEECYFSSVDDESLITINTNMGLFMCVIKPTNLYIFKELEYGERYDLPQDSAWVLEHSQDQSASAVVYEHNFNPLFESEKSLSLEIVWALSELEKVYKN